MSFVTVYSYLVPSLTVVSLLYASIEDIQYREVRREIIWLLMIGCGIILNILYLLLYVGSRAKTDILAEMLLTIVIGFIFGFVLFYLGAWGGADSKALWSIIILNPLHPFLETTGTLLNIQIDYIWVLDSSIISILLNSALLAIFYPIILVIINTFTATKGSLFGEVYGTISQKIRCFIFGYKKKVIKINPEKIHYDFLEELPDKVFTGLFDGNYKGELDGKFEGLLQAKFDGKFTGSIYGKFLNQLDKPIEDCDLEVIIKEAVETTTKINLLKDFDEDSEIDLELLKYRDKLYKKNESSIFNENQILNFTGQYTGSFNGLFIGTIDGLFEGTFNGKVLGKLEGDFSGKSSKGKLTGSTPIQDNKWQLKMRMGLDEDVAMEKRQLRTIWKLNTYKKETVWVTPGIPFVLLILLGYILYILLGNFILFLFRL